MNSYPVDADDGIDLRDLAARILARPWWIVTSVVLFTGAFIAAAFLIPPVYRASIILIPTRTDHDMGSGDSALGGIGGVASLVGINLGGGDSLTEETLAVLKSRQFTEKFISDLNLMPVLYAKKWDSQAGKWKVSPKLQPTPARAYKYFDKKIRTVTQEKKASLITLSVDWTDRVAAANWANDLIKRLNLEMRQREIARANSAVGYLEREFEATTAVATREAIGHLIEAQVKQRMLAEVTEEFALRIIDPAMAPDVDDRHFPVRSEFAIAGLIVGLIVGMLCVLGFGARAANSRRVTS